MTAVVLTCGLVAVVSVVLIGLLLTLSVLMAW